MKKNLHIVTVVLGVASLNLVIMAHESRFMNDHRRIQKQMDYEATMYYRRQHKHTPLDSVTHTMRRVKCTGH